VSLRLAEALHALLAATPEPPSADTDASEILILGQQMATEREGPLELLRALVEADPSLAEQGGELAETLRQRDARWNALLLRAHQELKHRVAAVAQSRRRATNPPR
jgi:hypothetical protein